MFRRTQIFAVLVLAQRRHDLGAGVVLSALYRLYIGSISAADGKSAALAEMRPYSKPTASAEGFPTARGARTRNACLHARVRRTHLFTVLVLARQRHDLGAELAGLDRARRLLVGRHREP